MPSALAAEPAAETAIPDKDGAGDPALTQAGVAIRVAEVARRVGDVIRSVAPELQVEHVGSTSVPGCGGKGIVDLAVLYGEGFLDRAKLILDGLGFQKQGGRDPFPESRPMRVACVE